MLCIYPDCTQSIVAGLIGDGDAISLLNAQSLPWEFFLSSNKGSDKLLTEVAEIINIFA